MLRLLQVNLQHSKAASAAFCRHFITCKIDIALIQEPWLVGGKIAGLGNAGGTIIYDRTSSRVRTCIVVGSACRGVPLTMMNLISGDLTAIRFKYNTGAAAKEVIIASVYLPYDSISPPPTQEMVELVDYCRAANLQLIMGADSNAHNIVWGSTNTNNRGEYLLEFIISNDLCVLNQGNEPTFDNGRRKEVIDITLATSRITNEITGWHVSREPSLSDHNYIELEVSNVDKTITAYRNPRNTNWEKYRQTLTSQLSHMSTDVRYALDIELVSDSLQEVIQNSYHESCPLVREVSRKVRWWTKELTQLRKVTRKLFNKAKSTGNWEIYYQTLTKYNKEVRKAKRTDWRNYCQEVEKTSEAARLQKIMAKEPLNPMGVLKKPDGTHTESGEDTVELLLHTHFPDSVIVTTDDREQLPPEIPYRRPCVEDWKTAKKVVSANKIEWAISTFKPYKSSGPDKVLPILLQEGKEALIPILCRLFRASIATGYIPTTWKSAEVVYIPKPGRKSYAEAKSYRPITLSSFVLKTLEKLVDKYIRETFLVERPLHRNQHAYQAGKSCETALHHLVTKIEATLLHKETAIGAFLDIEGAFDNTTFETMILAVKKHGIDNTCCRWIETMLKTRSIQISMFGQTTNALINRGCPQGGVLSPLLWDLVVNELLERLNNLGYYTQGYADDIVILIQGKYLNTISEVMQSALKLVENWCSKVNLVVNPTKTTLIPFTRKRKLEALKPPYFFGNFLEMKEEVKYLGVTLDSKLTWNPHLTRTIDKCKRAFMITRRTFGKSWGLKPNIMAWLYCAVIRPMITYGNLVWWPKMEQEQGKEHLRKLQRLACLCITSAMKTTPTAAMETMLNLPPLDIYIKGEARMGAYRLQKNNIWKTQIFGHSKITITVHNPVLEMGSDYMIRKTSFKKLIKTGINKPDQEWGTKEMNLVSKGCLVWYTDGSKTKEGTGAGVHCINPKVEISIPLGKHASVYQTEILAITACAQENIRRGYTRREIYIYSDSQAAIKAINSFQTKSKLTWECLQTLIQLAKLNRVYLEWVPGHKGIAGNEQADQLARKGSDTPYIGPEPAIGISKTEARSTVRNWVKRNHESYWARISGHRHSKQMMTRPSSTLTVDLLRLNRKQMRLVTGLITGHCGLRKHLHNMGIFRENPLCALCGEDEETASHVIFDCNALLNWRVSIIGSSNPREELLQNNLARRLLKLIEQLNLS